MVIELSIELDENREIISLSSSMWQNIWGGNPREESRKKGAGWG